MTDRYIYVPFPESQPGDFNKSALEKWGEKFPQENIYYKPREGVALNKLNGPFSFGDHDTRDIQIYIAGHGDKGLDKIANYERSGAADYHLIDAEIIFEEIVQLGLSKTFSGAIKCACCYSANKGDDISFAAQLGAYFDYEGYKSLTVFGYVDAGRRVKQSPIEPEIRSTELEIESAEKLLKYLKDNKMYNPANSPEEKRIAEYKKHLSDLRNLPDHLKGMHFWCVIQGAIPVDAPYNLRVGDETFLFRRSDRRKKYDPDSDQMVDAPRARK